MSNWYRFSGERISNLFETIEKDLEMYGSNEEVKFYVGSDSQPGKKTITYVTAIVMYREKSGGLVYYTREREPNVPVPVRLWNETYKAVAIAKELNDKLKKYDLRVNEIHADLNSDKKYKSNTSVQACLGFICGMGFKGKIKPEAWAASWIANKKTKKKSKNS